ncbi:MAG: hypothetical protein U0531_22325 [Dehalococcoidia bacterium]
MDPGGSRRGPTATATSENALSRDALLDNVMLYWLTGSSSRRRALSGELRQGVQRRARTRRHSCPPAAASSPGRSSPTPRLWAERCWPPHRLLERFSVAGYFAAFEQPWRCSSTSCAPARRLR